MPTSSVGVTSPIDQINHAERILHSTNTMSRGGQNPTLAIKINYAILQHPDLCSTPDLQEWPSTMQSLRFLLPNGKEGLTARIPAPDIRLIGRSRS